MALRDYDAWHDAYDRPGSSLHLRLLVVQDLVAEALDAAPPGPVRVVSMCAGQGRDLVTAAARHRRGADVTGRLVELLPENVADARRRIAAAGLDGLEVLEADAGVSDAYAGAAPADLVLACGIFGNVPDGDIEATVAFLPRLCAPSARVIWTRGPQDPMILDRIDGWFAAAGFAPGPQVVDKARSFGVGSARLVADPLPFEPGRLLFRFVR
jgi:SAM-dependent methyltransferase